VVWQQIFDQFKKAHPEIDLKVAFVDEEAYKVQLPGWLSTVSPDVVTWHNGERMAYYAKRGLFEDLTNDWNKNDWNSMYASTKEASSYNGKQYAAPTVYYSWGMFYRKDLFRKVGIATEPKTWPEFLDACKKLKAAGIAPVAVAGRDAWTLAGWFDYLDLRINGNAFHQKLMAGDVPYTDPRVKKVYTTWKELIDDKVFIDNSLSYDLDSVQPFLFQGKQLSVDVDNVREPTAPKIDLNLSFAPLVGGDVVSVKIKELAPGRAVRTIGVTGCENGCRLTALSVALLRTDRLRLSVFRISQLDPPRDIVPAADLVRRNRWRVAGVAEAGPVAGALQVVAAPTPFESGDITVATVDASLPVPVAATVDLVDNGSITSVDGDVVDAKVAQRPPACREGGEHFPERQHAHELAVVHDHERADVVVGHHLHGVDDGAVRRDREERVALDAQDLADEHGTSVAENPCNGGYSWLRVGRNADTYLYRMPGSHKPMPGKMYRSASATTWMPMNGIMPAKIWLSVTCGGETPFR